MAKTYLNTVKYEVKAKYEVTGVVEKPDIIGAIFGQSEGMLGTDMDLKELQQGGKLGRIEITVNKAKGKTYGEIIIPSSLDQVKTSILAATVETVEKVGPCEAKLTILSIRDTRKEKREQITDRAKQLLQKMQKFESVESSDLTDSIKSTMRTEKAITYKGMTAGPEIETSDHIILVEGRADVLKLLSYGIKNAIEMNGSNISKDLIELCNRKTVIVLTDGDRGGDLNAKKLASLTTVEYVARAPDGKEVEELTQKEILQALKRRQEFSDSPKRNESRPNFNDRRNNHYDRNNNYNRNNNYDRNSPQRSSYNSNYSRPQGNGYDRRPNYSSSGPRGNDNRGSYGERRHNDSRRPFQNRGSYEERGSDRFDPFKNNYRKSAKTIEEEKAKAEAVAKKTATAPSPTETATKKTTKATKKAVTKKAATKKATKKTTTKKVAKKKATKKTTTKK